MSTTYLLPTAILPRVIFFLRRLLLSLLIVLPVAAHAAAGSNEPLTRSSSRQLFMVTMIPPAQPIAVNQMHSWQVRITRADGSPVKRAVISVDGGMPQHNHGLPTRPQVTQALGQGTFLLEGMKFNMPGWWEIVLQIEADKEKDSAHFQILIELPPAIAPASAAKSSGSAGMK